MNNVNLLTPPILQYNEINDWITLKLSTDNDFSLPELANVCKSLKVSPEHLYWTIEQYCKEHNINLNIEKDEQETETSRKLSLISFFKKPIWKTVPSENLSIAQVYNKIVSKDYLNQTSRLREISVKKDRQEFKKNNLDWVTFSGTFSKRDDAYLIEYSQLVCMDIDNISNPEEIKQKLCKESFTELCFISPSGNGLKWVVEVEEKPEFHREVYEDLQNYLIHKFKLNPEATDNTKDISRACWLGYDPECFINPKYL